MLGEWVGTNRLWCEQIAPDQVNESPSRLRVSGVASGKLLLLTYIWELDGAPHEGVLLVGNENERHEVSASWGDSWHQSASLLTLSGTGSDTGEVVLNGTFAAPPEPGWGWKITLAQPDPRKLVFTMFVIPWNGTEKLSVGAEYCRA